MINTKQLFVTIALTVLSFIASANEDKTFHTTMESCNAPDALYYTPALKRPAPKEWKREVLMRDTCVQMDTVQGRFHVKLKEGTELAQNPKTGAWHHVLCTNWTNWKQQVPEKLAECLDCNKVIEHTTVIKERVIVQCANGETLSFDGDKKIDPTAVCPKITVTSPVETKTVVATKATAECKDCTPRPAQSELQKLCVAENGKAKCTFKVTYETLRAADGKTCGIQNRQANQLAVIHGVADGSDECCLRKEALLAVLKKVARK